MTAPSRGRGRPALFNADAQQRYLEARAAGATQKDAAALVRVAANTIRYHRATDHAFREADDTAAACGRQARIDQLAHGETRYKHYGCRCTTCTKAATVGRTNRPSYNAKEARIIPISPTGQESSCSFPLARAS
ncbi:hypothetical protein [Streptomyces sp.]|uniref:hypothetical protein n=1 Tax=Streptomyces sp. TaxID=1931 RepID=UPI002F3E3E79